MARIGWLLQGSNDLVVQLGTTSINQTVNALIASNSEYTKEQDTDGDWWLVRTSSATPPIGGAFKHNNVPYNYTGLLVGPAPIRK